MTLLSPLSLMPPYQWCHVMVLLLTPPTTPQCFPISLRFPQSPSPTTIKALWLPPPVLQTLGCIAHLVIPIPQYSLESLMPFPLLLCSYPYSTHQFTNFKPYHIDGEAHILKPTARPHVTYIHTLELHSFCREHGVCLTHYPYRC